MNKQLQINFWSWLHLSKQVLGTIVAQYEITRELRFMRFTPFNRSTCKNVLPFSELLFEFFKNMMQAQQENTGERTELLLESDLELPATFKGSLREGVQNSRTKSLYYS